jgi:hypothetical protein
MAAPKDVSPTPPPVFDLDPGAESTTSAER